jgi:hypothetical protein
MTDRKRWLSSGILRRCLVSVDVSFFSLDLTDMDRHYDISAVFPLRSHGQPQATTGRQEVSDIGGCLFCSCRGIYMFVGGSSVPEHE